MENSCPTCKENKAIAKAKAEYASGFLERIRQLEAVNARITSENLQLTEEKRSTSLHLDFLRGQVRELRRQREE